MFSYLKLPENNSSITAPGDHILLGFYDAWSFETPRINNHSVNSPSPLIVLVFGSAQSFETTPKETVSLHQVPIFLLGSDSLKCQHKNRSHIPGQKVPPSRKEYIFFQMGGK